MSNLGKIYVVDLESRVREAYPIVYENNYLYVCKVYGSYNTKTFFKSQKSQSVSIWGRVYTLEEYMSIVNYDENLTPDLALPSTFYNIYEPPHVHYDFKSLFNVNTMALCRRLIKDIKLTESDVKYWEKAISDYSEKMDKAKESLSNAKTKVKIKQRKLNSILEEAGINDRFASKMNDSSSNSFK